MIVLSSWLVKVLHSLLLASSRVLNAAALWQRHRWGRPWAISMQLFPYWKSPTLDTLAFFSATQTILPEKYVANCKLTHSQTIHHKCYLLPIHFHWLKPDYCHISYCIYICISPLEELKPHPLSRNYHSSPHGVSVFSGLIMDDSRCPTHQGWLPGAVNLSLVVLTRRVLLRIADCANDFHNRSWVLYMELLHNWKK